MCGLITRNSGLCRVYRMYALVWAVAHRSLNFEDEILLRGEGCNGPNLILFLITLKYIYTNMGKKKDFKGRKPLLFSKKKGKRKRKKKGRRRRNRGKQRGGVDSQPPHPHTHTTPEKRERKSEGRRRRWGRWRPATRPPPFPCPIDAQIELRGRNAKGKRRRRTAKGGAPRPPAPATPHPRERERDGRWGDEVRLTGGRPPPHSPGQTRTRSKRAREGKGTTGEIPAGDTAAPPWTIGGGWGAKE